MEAYVTNLTTDDYRVQIQPRRLHDGLRRREPEKFREQMVSNDRGDAAEEIFLRRD